MRPAPAATDTTSTGWRVLGAAPSDPHPGYCTTHLLPDLDARSTVTSTSRSPPQRLARWVSERSPDGFCSSVPFGPHSQTALAAICTAVQLAGLALPLAVTGSVVLFPTMFGGRLRVGSDIRASTAACRRTRRRRPVRRTQRPHPTRLDTGTCGGTARARYRRNRARLADHLGGRPGAFAFAGEPYVALGRCLRD